MKNFVKLIISVVVCEFAGAIGSFFTTPAVRGWYPTLIKPSFNPPNWLFAPVWTTLFLMMGIAMFLIWKKEKRGLTIFFAQLFFNVLWSIMFFGLKSPLLGFIVIVILWFLILATIVKFFKVSKTAGWLLVPYIFWVTFASILNFSILILN
ncbi:MAG: TspO protein [Candidatus Portnoybacteria bacterium RBG_13_40_8]|uniref:TspO protein n=1 Tax=Candidatus Portnoybacteria bacterium RBG_13_40_8 TaxID=1801990 RepID=A0A1G2F4L1_9BACT|nr:MAG: TspO protein [Candidatus Portnoybacteria bacterium RBG_13_40_8]OGZ35047.1 MAG: TspO protein [Candidatus Portnoybacteria bacterium RIFCSPHIGHO2_01_FULL_39_19]